MSTTKRKFKLPKQFRTKSELTQVYNTVLANQGLKRISYQQEFLTTPKYLSLIHI